MKLIFKTADDFTLVNGTDKVHTQGKVVTNVICAYLLNPELEMPEDSAITLNGDGTVEFIGDEVACHQLLDAIVTRYHNMPLVLEWNDALAEAFCHTSEDMVHPQVIELDTATINAPHLLPGTLRLQPNEAKLVCYSANKAFVRANGSLRYGQALWNELSPNLTAFYIETDVDFHESNDAEEVGILFQKYFCAQ